VHYKEMALGEQRVPIIVQDLVVVFPRTDEIDDTAVAGSVCLLRLSGQPIGLLLNFGRSRLDIRRIAN